MNINIPPDSEAWLFQRRDGDDQACLWSFRYPPPCEVYDWIHFRFGGLLVARARVYAILPPGERDTFAHHGKRFLSGHKTKPRCSVASAAGRPATWPASGPP